MTVLAITRRPIVLETQASGAMLTDTLANLEATNGRMALYGVTDLLRAKLLASSSFEAVFNEGYYRNGHVVGTAISTIPGWTFSRTGAGFATNLSRSLDTFATGVPRLTDKGLLVEGATTNLLRHSQDFANAVWAKTNITVFPDQITAPDGTLTADRVQATATGAAYTYQTVTGAGSATGNDFSIYAKVGSSSVNANQFGVENATSGVILCLFTLNYNTGAITYSHQSSASNFARVTAMANGWWRIDIRIGAGVANGNDLVVYPGFSSASVNTAHCYVWGAMLKTGQSRASYVPTTSAAATRGADMPVAAIDGVSEGAVFVEFDLGELPAAGLSQTAIELNDAGGTNRVLLYRVDDQVRVYYSLSGVASSMGATGFDDAHTVRAALRWAGQKLSLFIDGAQVGTDTTFVGSFAVMNKLLFGANLGGTENLGNYVRRAAYFTTPPTTAECIAMTVAP